ncbi:MAG TPA: hypothetical protein VFO25_10380 [Candidatus Eremiobacteraceae bacterium]|nr:hypothetical protein [Candidatus Eremiobacteraceae bacterium]
MDFNPNDKNQERYVDSPVFAEILMILMTVVLGIATWGSIHQTSPSYLAAGIFGFFTILCAIGVLTQKRRTFTFDKASQTMSWTSRGLRENASGSVGFSDVSIGLDSMMDKNMTFYRLMIATPKGTWPLTNSYDLPLKQAEAQAAHLRELVGGGH